MKKLLPLILLSCLWPTAIHGVVVPADPFRMPVRAIDLSPHSTVGDSLIALLAKIGFQLDLSGPRLGRRIAAQPLPQWVVRDEILTLRELIGEVVGPGVVLLIDPARRSVSLDMSGSVLAETQQDRTLQSCMQVVSLSGLLNQNEKTGPRHASAPTWRVVGAAADPASEANPWHGAASKAHWNSVGTADFPPAAEVGNFRNPVGTFDPWRDSATGALLNPAGAFYPRQDSGDAPKAEDALHVVSARDGRAEYASVPAGLPGFPLRAATGEIAFEVAPVGLPGATPQRPSDEVEMRKYVVTAGDSLSALARRFQPPGWSFRETFESIIQNSPAMSIHADFDHLEVGQVLYLPVPRQSTALLPPTHSPSPKMSLPQGSTAVTPAVEPVQASRPSAHRSRLPAARATEAIRQFSELGPPAGVVVDAPGVSAHDSFPASTVAEETSTQAPRDSSPAAAAVEEKRPSTYLLRLDAGSLRNNLIRILADHDHTLGHWGFGNAEEEIDWHIPKGYSWIQPNDLAVVLRALGEIYSLRAVINELDHTVDFAPARAWGNS